MGPLENLGKLVDDAVQGHIDVAQTLLKSVLVLKGEPVVEEDTDKTYFYLGEVTDRSRDLRGLPKLALYMDENKNLFVREHDGFFKTFSKKA